MNILEQFLHSIAYKFPKGYPDMDNEQDILILENEFKKIGINLNELETVPHWGGRVRERGNILDILNFPKDYPLSKQEVTQQIEDELIKRATRLEKLKELPTSIPYQIGYKLFKPLLSYNGRNIPLNLKVEYTTKGEKKIGIGTSFVALIENNTLITLLLLSEDDTPSIELSMENHRKREKKKPKPVKVITPGSYEFPIAPAQQNIDTKLDPTTLPYKLRTDYRKGADFEHNEYGEGTIVTTSAGSGGKGDARGRLDWVEVDFGKPYVSGGQLKKTRIIKDIHTLVSPDLNIRAAE